LHVLDGKPCIKNLSNRYRYLPTIASMAQHIFEEAQRCLQCKKPLCKAGCPVGTPVNEMVALLLGGDIKGAGRLVFENNPLSIVCSLVCPHESQCEGHCVLGKKGSPIHVSSIERYISDFFLGFVGKKTEIDRRKKVAIIGSGPAGLTIAIRLALKGFDITVFEAHDHIGGVLRYGIPEFRLPKEILDRYCKVLHSLGVKIRPNTLIGPYITVDDLFRDGFKAVFIGTGVWKPRTLSIPGETLGHVHFAIDYLKNPAVYSLGKKVVIIGAGNVAMDVARTAMRMGSEQVTITYRKAETQVTARHHEVAYAKFDGVEFACFLQPVRIQDDGVVFVKTRLVEGADPDDHLADIEILDEEVFLEADSVIIAISQGPRANIVNSTSGIDVDISGLLRADEQGRTSRDGIFASGDIVTGARTVVEAVKWSKIVADAIEKHVEDKL